MNGLQRSIEMFRYDDVLRFEACFLVVSCLTLTMEEVGM
jgi:hypothetical protein